MGHGKAGVCTAGSGLSVCELPGVPGQSAWKHFPAGTPAPLKLWEDQNTPLGVSLCPIPFPIMVFWGAFLPLG